ncbi:MAG: hypothetical protein N4A45_07580 [Flavobacteriales bacterium]|jgi:hypothetical protein|nr:hypothetical protein [Flavobacteriales bacterium]
MKKSVAIVFILISFMSCKNSKLDKIGKWDLVSDYYQATYQIIQHNGHFVCKLDYYNDGIKVLHPTNTDEDIIFRNIQFRDQEKNKPDAISGATKKTDKTLYLHSLSKDTLKAIYYVKSQQKTEYWTRKK